MWCCKRPGETPVTVLLRGRSGPLVQILWSALHMCCDSLESGGLHAWPFASTRAQAHVRVHE